MKRIKKLPILIVTLLFFIVMSITIPKLVSGEMNDGTVELNKGMINLEKMFDKDQKLAPSQIVTSKEIKITNTGTLSLKIFERLLISLKQNGFTDQELNKMLDKYFIRIHLYQNGKELNIKGISKNWIKASEINSIFRDEKGIELSKINSNDSVSMFVDVKLSEDSGNEYQSALLNISFVGGGISEINQGGQILPSTSTNIFNKLVFGVIIVLIGYGYFYLRKEDKNSDPKVLLEK